MSSAEVEELVEREKSRVEVDTLRQLEVLEEEAKAKFDKAKQSIEKLHEEAIKRIRDENEIEISKIKEEMKQLEEEQRIKVEELQEKIESDEKLHKIAYRAYQTKVGLELKQLHRQSEEEILHLKNDLFIEKQNMEKMVKRELEHFEDSQTEKLRVAKEQQAKLFDGRLKEHTLQLEKVHQEKIANLKNEHSSLYSSEEEEAKKKLDSKHKESLDELVEIHEAEILSLKEKLEQARKELFSELEQQEVSCAEAKSKNHLELEQIQEETKKDIEEIRLKAENEKEQLLKRHEDDLVLLKDDLISEYEQKREELEQEFAKRHEEYEGERSKRFDCREEELERDFENFKGEISAKYKKKKVDVEAEARRLLEEFKEDLVESGDKQRREMRKQQETLAAQEQEEVLAVYKEKLEERRKKLDLDLKEQETLLDQAYAKRFEEIESSANQKHNNQVERLEAASRKRSDEARAEYEKNKRDSDLISERSKELVRNSERKARQFKMDAEDMERTSKEERKRLVKHFEEENLKYLTKLKEKQAESQQRAYEHAKEQQKFVIQEQARKLEEYQDGLEQSLKDIWPIKPGDTVPSKPTQGYYTFCLANRGVSTECEDYVRKVDYWLDRRRHLALPAIINTSAEYRFGYWTDRQEPIRVNRVRPPTPDIEAGEIREITRKLAEEAREKREGLQPSSQAASNLMTDPRSDSQENILGASASGTTIKLVTPAKKASASSEGDKGLGSHESTRSLTKVSTCIVGEENNPTDQLRGGSLGDSPRKEGGGTGKGESFDWAKRLSEEIAHHKRVIGLTHLGISDTNEKGSTMGIVEKPIVEKVRSVEEAAGPEGDTSQECVSRVADIKGKEIPGNSVPGKAEETVKFHIECESSKPVDLEGPNPLPRVSSIMMDEITKAIRDMVADVGTEQKRDSKRALEKTVEDIMEKVRADKDTSMDLEEVIKEMSDKTERRPQHLPEFDPKVNEVDDFIIHFEDIMTHRNEPIHKRISQLKICCRSSARQYLEEILTEEGYTYPEKGVKQDDDFNLDWYKEKILEGLRKRYSSRSDLTAEVSVEALIKKDDETLIQYYDRVVQTCRRADKTGTQITCAFVKGLPSSYKRFILGRSPGILKGSPDEAVELARQCEGIHQYDVMDGHTPISVVGSGGRLLDSQAAKTPTETADNTSRASIAKMGNVMLQMAKRIEEAEKQQRDLRGALQNAQKQLKDKRQPEGMAGNFGNSGGSDNPNWRSRPQRQNSNRMSSNQPVVCHYCSRTGHVMAACRLLASIRQQQYSNPSGAYPPQQVPGYSRSMNGNPWNRGRGGSNGWSNYGQGQQRSMTANPMPPPALPAPVPRQAIDNQPAQGNKYGATGSQGSLN